MSKIALDVFQSGGPDKGFIGWSPVRLTISGDNGSGSSSVVLSSQSVGSSISRAVFMKEVGDEPADEITVDLGPRNRATIFVAGKFQEGQRHNGASEDCKDVLVQARWADQATQVDGSLELMIRVRKNANELSDKARKNFVRALAELNGIKTGENPTPGPGKGIYVTDFVGMHVAGASDSEHGDSQFLPWHRLYLLDLERLLQNVNPAVTLPYWRFDQPAGNLFSEDFIGATEAIPPYSDFTQGTSDKRATFSPSNPLSRWQIGDVAGIPRAAFFDTKTEAAPGLPPAPNRRPFQLVNQEETLALGGRDPETAEFGALRTGFSGMEGTPHGAAHISFNGYVNFVPVAPQDPLFFLLHCNVDRLWALWQFLFKRDAARNELSYPYQNKFQINFALNTALSGSFPDYWKVIDSLQWPWDNTQSKPFNLFPPGTRSANFTRSTTGKQINADIPSIEDAMDAFGHHDPANYLGFSYDDTPFDHEWAAENFT